MEELVLDKRGSRLWLNMYRVTRNLSILHIQGNPDSGIWEILVETGIRDIFLVKSGILGFGIRNTAQGIWIPMTTGIQNPSSTDKECGTKYLESGIHGVESRLQACLRFPFNGATNTSI